MCVLRVSGRDFDVDTFVATTQLKPCKVFHRGDPRLASRGPDDPGCDESGMNLPVSDAEWDDVQSQIADAERFLNIYRDDLQRLQSAPGVTEIALDFPIELRIDGDRVAIQSDRFPPSLARLAGSLGIALELSIYPRNLHLENESPLDETPIDLHSSNDYTYVDLPSVTARRMDQPSYHLFSEANFRGQVFNYNVGGIFPEVQIDGSALLQCITGKVQVAVNRRPILVSPGGLVLINPGARFSVQAISDATFQILWSPPHAAAHRQ